VLGQAHTPRQRFLLLSVIALAVLTAPAVSGAISSHGASALRAHDAALAARSHDAVLDLYSLDQKLAVARSRLAVLQKQTVSLRAERASLTHQLSIAKRGTHLAQGRLAARLRTLYEQGNVEPLEIVFGAKTIDEAMSGLDNLNRMTSQGEDVLRQLKTARASLGAASKGLASREAALATAVSSARATASSLASTRAARSSYIASLAAQRRLTQQQISSVVAQANAAQLRTQQLARVSATESAGATGAPASAVFSWPAPAAAGGRTITVSATGYSLQGRTATGLPVGFGVAAVDPSVIPLGTHLTIPGYGEAVAADTGGAIIGATIDLWFPTNAQANAWGRRTVAVVLH
jgi:3D (Asp-Asp-Asp) domain-containing protein